MANLFETKQIKDAFAQIVLACDIILLCDFYADQSSHN